MCKWLDKRVMGFRQTVREFFTSKTNMAAIATIIGVGAAISQGQMDYIQGAQLVVPAVIGLFLKDAHAASQGDA